MTRGRRQTAEKEVTDMTRRTWFATRVAARLVLATCWLALLAEPARAQGYQPPNTLDWPLGSRECNDQQGGFDPNRVADGDVPCVIRRALGNSLGEYQYFAPDPEYLHTGIDIRGTGYHRDKDTDKTLGDVIRIVKTGYVWFAPHFENDQCIHISACRVYVVDANLVETDTETVPFVPGTNTVEDARYIYYYSHLSMDEEDTVISVRARTAMTNALPWPSTPDPNQVYPDTEVEAGALLGRITRFDGPTGYWEHLHFGIVDPQGNFDVVNPLTALRPDGMSDQTPPTISEIGFRRDQVQGFVAPQGDCNEISGSLDVLAEMKDSYRYDAALPGTNSIGVYAAQYLIRQVSPGGVHQEGTWFEFDRLPILCQGCGVSPSIFFDNSYRKDRGQLMAGLFAPQVFDGASQSHYWNTETYWHVLTNEWGMAGSWDTTLPAVPDGRYQVSAVAWDQAGNGTAMSIFVYVHNDTSQPVVPVPDAYVRDNLYDVGALPSTLGGYPFWTSPDIILYETLPPDPPPHNDPSWIPGEIPLVAGDTYYVYVRIFNAGCYPAENVKTKVYSANPDLDLGDPSQWTTITPPGQFVGDSANPDGVTVPAGGMAVLGPFEFTPDEALVEEAHGHRCLLAQIQSDIEPVGDPLAVADNNNVAQRNIQVNVDTSIRIHNPLPATADLELEMRCNTFPIYDPEATVALVTEYHPALAAAWQDAPGAQVTVDQAANEIEVRFQQCNLHLPVVAFPAHASVQARMDLVLPPTANGIFYVDLYQRVNGALRGGMTFYASQFIVL